MSDQNEPTEVSLSVNGGPAVKLDGGIQALAAKLKKGAIPVELRESKVFKAFAKETDDKQAAALLEKTDDELKMILAENVLRKDDLRSKLNENKEYVKAKDIVTTLDGGMKSTMKGSDLCAKLAKAVLKARK